MQYFQNSQERIFEEEEEFPFKLLLDKKQKKIYQGYMQQMLSKFFGSTFNQNSDQQKINQNNNSAHSIVNFGFIKDKISNSFSNINQKSQEVQTALRSWKTFALFFISGFLFLFVSFLYLPLIFIMPAKFSALFSLGSLCIIISLAIIKGYSQFFRAMIHYFITLLLTVYFAMISKNYLLVLIFSFLQIASLCWLIASMFPGGVAGMKFISSQCFGCFKSICLKVFHQQQNQSFLPI